MIVCIKGGKSERTNLLYLSFTIPRVLFGRSFSVVVVVVVGIQGGRMPGPRETRGRRSAELLLFVPSSGSGVRSVTRLAHVSSPLGRVTRRSAAPPRRHRRLVLSWNSSRHRSVLGHVTQHFSVTRLVTLLSQWSPQFRLVAVYPRSANEIRTFYTFSRASFFRRQVLLVFIDPRISNDAFGSGNFV